jgi:Na+/melibiose symporter-like transporter
LLASGGYVPNAVPDQSTRTAILLAVGLVPAGMLALAFGFMWRYPLTDQRFDVLLKEIGARAGRT